MSTSTSGANRLVSVTRGVPLERKLPLLISALLMLMLVIASVAAYREVSRSASEAASTRVTSVTDQLVSLTRTNTAARMALMRRVAADTAVKNLLDGSRSTYSAPESSGIAIVPMRARHAAPDSGVRVALGKLAVPTESLLVARVWDASGQVRAAAGAPPSDSDALRAGDLLRRMGQADTVMNSPLYLSKDSVVFWTIATVMDHGAVIGHVGQRRRIARNPVAEKQFGELLGQDMRIYFANARGDVAATLGGTPTTATAIPPHAARTVFAYDRPGEGRRLASSAPISGTPWVVLVDMPKSLVDVRPRAFLRRMAMVTAVLVLAGALLAWGMSRRLTRPLAELTTATSAVARGDYEHRVDVTTRDELGRLGDAFNVMAARVASARRDLERTAAALGDTNEALRKSNAELEAQTAVAEAARREAVAASQAKSDFLAVMSHELRTPLNAILGFSSLMLDEIPGPVSDAQRAQLGRINAGGRHLLSLIDEVLTLARVEAGRESVRTDEGDVYALVRETVSFADPMAHAKGLTLRAIVPDGECVVRTDLTKVRQILLNLVTNAVKFTSEGEVTVDARCDGAQLILEVRDTGIGIERQHLPKIFEPFYQVDQSKTRRAAGTGLGLSVTRNLARLLGGDVRVASTPGVGSTFTVVILVQAPHAKDEPLARATAGC